MNLSSKRSLHKWYQQHKRDLPWRENQDPYRIWISETMLQQTTTTAVTPYFDKFIRQFPNLKKLAAAKEAQVLEAWAGLGYYSRARNLHKAAKQLAKLKTFPRSHEQLIEYPGFGPYTSRAVSSLAFGESVGVLDGNVIRVLSRFHNLPVEWWKTSGRKQLQIHADQVVQKFESGEMNQALMELGATLCLPQSPRCALCPLLKSCQAQAQSTTEILPLPKPRKQKENWVWRVEVHERKGRVALVRNDYAPFLKGQWFLPGAVRKSHHKPKAYDFKHCITHHEIFVKVNSRPSSYKKLPKDADKLVWVQRDEVAQWVPASLVAKALSITAKD